MFPFILSYLLSLYKYISMDKYSSMIDSFIVLLVVIFLEERMLSMQF